jgi:hypothetical protein
VVRLREAARDGRSLCLKVLLPGWQLPPRGMRDEGLRVQLLREGVQPWLADFYGRSRQY